jgi:putative transposase
MAKGKKLSHTIYQCKYHIVWCPKYRYRILKYAVAEFVESNLKMLCELRSIEILETNVKEDHIHMILSVPLKIIDIRSNGNAKK